jgi:hypothetical protein
MTIRNVIHHVFLYIHKTLHGFLCPGAILFLSSKSLTFSTRKIRWKWGNHLGPHWAHSEPTHQALSSTRRSPTWLFHLKCAKQPAGSVLCGHYVYKFLQATDKYIANREYVCRCCYIYLNYVSVFYTSILCFTVILPLLIIFPLHEYPNVVVLCGLRDMEAHTVEFIDSDTCHFLRREVFHKMNASSTPEVPLVAYP